MELYTSVPNYITIKTLSSSKFQMKLLVKYAHFRFYKRV